MDFKFIHLHFLEYKPLWIEQTLSSGSLLENGVPLPIEHSRGDNYYVPAMDA